MKGVLHVLCVSIVYIPTTVYCPQGQREGINPPSLTLLAGQHVYKTHELKAIFSGSTIAQLLVKPYQSTQELYVPIDGKAEQAVAFQHMCPDWQSQPQTALFAAARYGYYEIVDDLSGLNASVQEKEPKTEKFPVVLAAENGHKLTVEKLITYHPEKHEEIVKLFILWPAVEHQQIHILDSFCPWGFDKKNIDITVMSAVFRAVQLGYTDALEVFLEHDFPVDWPISYHRSALYIALLSDQKEAVKTLLHYGAAVDQPINQRLHTPLMHCCMWGLEKIAAILLQNKANINAQDLYGQTPLMHAVWWRKEKMINFLLQFQPDLTIQDTQKKTVLDWAFELKLIAYQKKLVDYLLEQNKNNSN